MTIDHKNKPLAVLIDFDGTITTHDIGVHVIANFAEPGWEEAEKCFHSGEINVRELWFIEAHHLRKSRRQETIDDAVSVAEIRSGFSAFVDYCSSNSVAVEVVSSGMDFYVDSILDAKGLGALSRSRPVLEYDDDERGVLKMPHGLRDCAMTALCKCDRVWEWRRKGYRVAFIGDGASDECVVTQADIVFATSRLANTCEAKGIDHTPFDSFVEVLEVIRGELE